MAESLTPMRPPSRRASSYRGRFGLAYFLLAALLGVGVGLFVLLEGGGPGGSSAWSLWRPSASGRDALRQIADFVSRRYRLPSGTQLTGVIIRRPPTVTTTTGTARAPQDIPIEAIAVKTGSSGDVAKDYSIFTTDQSLEYILCGFGDRCSIAEGKPSLERARLLRREALELALYTFKYVSGVDSVVTFIPPRPDPAAKTFALYFQKDGLREQLERPLRETLRRRDLLRPGNLRPAESAKIDALTMSRLYSFNYQPAPDGSAILVLDPAL